MVASLLQVASDAAAHRRAESSPNRLVGRGAACPARLTTSTEEVVVIAPRVISLP
jgi:hypothetical protein